METLRPFSLVASVDQWMRAAFDGTTLDREAGLVTLDWDEPEAETVETTEAVSAGGLAFDSGCRLYRSDPEHGRVLRQHWTPKRTPGAPADSVEIFANANPPVFGDFTASDESLSQSAPLREPRGLAIDRDDRLFIADAGAREVLVYDLPSRRLLRRVSVAPARPLDLATDGRIVYALLADPPGLIRFTARGESRQVELPQGLSAPTRLALQPAGDVWLLDHAGTAAARIVPRITPASAFDVAFAGDLEFTDRDTLVVARRPGDDFLRYRLGPDSRDVLQPLKAHGYDGGGIARAPDGRVAYWTEVGARNAAPAHVTYHERGRVTTFRLDSGAFQTVWGRVFLDACLPEGTTVLVHCATTDEMGEEPTLPRTPPPTVELAEIRRPDLSPPMPPLSLVPEVTDVVQSLHRRTTGREVAWTQPAVSDPLETYEAPISAPPGRFLWVTLELRGTGRRSPQIRRVRAEHPTHDYLRRLPRTFSRAEAAAAFLQRYLAPLEGLLGELEARATERHALLEPRDTPADALPWLASFVGLVLDERWPLSARRALVREAVPLFRARGTVWGLTRFIELYTGVEPILIEHFHLRGIFGSLLGAGGQEFGNSVVGVGFRVGGAAGSPETEPLTGTIADAFATHAHRFTVIVPAALTPEGVQVVRDILDVHRPAHTIVDLCTAGAGMRVGRGLHVGLSSTIGPTGGFATLELGATPLGRGTTLGRAATGTVPGAKRLGRDTRVG